MNARLAVRLCGAVVLCACAVLHGCAQQRTADDRRSGAVTHADVQLLAEYLSGSFSSGAQSVEDPENFLDIRLNTARIWADRDDVPRGVWLYVEQAAATSLDRPYRQRVYHLSIYDDRTIESAIYVLPGDPIWYVGAHRDPSKLAALNPDDLVSRDGCSVFLRFDADEVAFIGSTRGSECPSQLRGAAYATSEVIVTRDRLLSWDRGFDADGRQVWGSTEGAYRFDRIGQ